MNCILELVNLIQKYIIPIFLIVLLSFRFFQDLRLSQKFQPGQKVKLNFCLFKEPYIYPDGQYFYYQNHFQTIKIKLAETKKYQLGNCLEIVGGINRCQNQSKADWCLLSPSKIIFTAGKKPKFYLAELVKQFDIIREKLTKPILRQLPYPEADLLAGIVFGRQQKLDKIFFSQLQKSGILHIIVASGYNLMVVGQKPAYYLSYFLGFYPAVVLGILLIWVYVGITGFQVPVLRAGVMLSFLLLAKLAGRKYQPVRVLIFSVWLLLMIKPDLIVDISFQLSVAALSGLMLGQRVFNKWQDKNWLSSIVAETLSAQLLVIPLIILHFRKLSLLAPVSNVFVIPLVPPLMYLGIAAVGFSWLPYVRELLLFLSYPILSWMVVVIKFFADLPFSEINIPF